jgi:hypothetical protein
MRAFPGMMVNIRQKAYRTNTKTGGSPGYLNDAIAAAPRAGTKLNVPGIGMGQGLEITSIAYLK